MHKQMTRNEKLEKLYKLIGDNTSAMLVTQTATGQLRSRPMAMHTTDEDAAIWFMTDRTSAKILQINENRQVNISFSNSVDGQYVSISGTATIVEDRVKVQKMWSAAATKWFPGGVGDPNLTLIRVGPTIAEYWDSNLGAFVTAYEIAKATLTSPNPTYGIGDGDTVRM